MGYSDSNYQIGRMLHKEYEATYAGTNHSPDVKMSGQKLRFKPTNLLSIVMLLGILTGLPLII